MHAFTRNMNVCAGRSTQGSWYMKSCYILGFACIGSRELSCCLHAHPPKYYLPVSLLTCSQPTCIAVCNFLCDDLRGVHGGAAPAVDAVLHLEKKCRWCVWGGACGSMCDQCHPAFQRQEAQVVFRGAVCDCLCSPLHLATMDY